MKKVLFFIESLSGGGAEKVLSDLVKNLDSKKYEITVKTVTDGGIYGDQIEGYCSLDSILHEIDYRSKGIRKFIYCMKYFLIYHLPARLVYNLWLKGDYDIIVGFVEGFATKIVSAAGSDARKLAWVHVDPIERNYADNYYSSIALQKRAYSAFDKVICVSHSVEASFKQKFEISDSVSTIYNPIDKKTIMKLSTIAEETSENHKKNRVNFISVGRLEKQKGYDRLIQAISSFPRDSYRLLILGEGTEREALKKQICENGLQDNVQLLGFKENPYAYMANSDAFICSSRAEGYSLVIAEAMVLGLPIITTECSGPNELTENGKYGIMVENSSDGIKFGISSFLNDRDKLSYYSELSKVRSLVFDLSSTIKKVEKVLDGDQE